MIKDYFIFDGVNSASFNVIVDSADVFGKPAVGLSTVKIPGRHGELLLYDDRFDNVTVSYQCHCDYHFRFRFDSLIMELASKKGYKRLEDSVFPDHFRRAYFQGPVSAKLLRSYRAGSFKVDFRADPRKFLKAGELPLKYEANGTIFNPTSFTAKPLIRCYGTGGAISVGGIWMGITGCSAYIDIDCELLEAYEGSVNRNGNVGGDFPTLKPGANTVGFSGFSYIEITPRWWRI